MRGWNVYSRWMRKVERRVNTPFRRQIPTVGNDDLSGKLVRPTRDNTKLSETL